MKVNQKRMYAACSLCTGLLLFGTPVQAVGKVSIIQQNVGTCSGVIKDSHGEPIIGATIKVKGQSGKGAVSDLDGNFTIKGLESGVTLEISYIGFKDKEVVWQGSSLDISLSEDNKTLDDVVVVGYATQKKVNLTGSVSSVSSKDLQDIPVANTTTLLQGRMPGLVLTQAGGQAGAEDLEVRIRGIGTFGNNNPMVLIDGVEGSLSQISDIPSADIESVSVLKDAASAAIYGVRAANGVILITTKRGKEGRATVNYSGSYSWQTATILPNYLDSYNWALMSNEAGKNVYSPEALQKLKDGSDPDHYANTDWLGEVFRTAPMMQHHLSVSGGSETTHYMTSVSFLDQDGIMRNTAAKKISFRSNIDTKYKRFKFGVNLSGNKNDVDSPAGISPSGATSVMRYLSWYTRPTVPVKYSNGHYGYVDGTNTNAEDIKNPVEIMNLGYNNNVAYRFNGKAFAALDIWDGLTLQTSFAYNFYLNTTKTYTPKDPARYDAEGNIKKSAGANNTLKDYYYREGTWTNENLLTYNKKFGLHSIGVLLGHSLIGYEYYTTTATKQGFPTENIYELDGGSKNATSSGNKGAYRLQSFFGRLNYNYNDTYMFEFNIRRDGSSRMPKVNRYATFPSVSAGWVFTNEKFMAKLPWLFGKLRASWGKLGNQEIGNYAYITSLGASGKYYFDQKGDPTVGMVQTSIPNENIKWETTTSFNIGIDLGFFNNKIQTTFEVYNKKTSDILMQLAMPNIFLGSLSAPYQNVGTVKNIGWEWSANYQDGIGDWKWFAGFNLSHVKNEIVYMGGLEERISGSTINRVGEPIGAYYGLKALGLYRTEEDLNRTNSQGVVIKQNGSTPQLGDVMYADLNDDGNINDADRTIIGKPFPKLTYGFTLGGSWKGFDLTTFWQGVSGIYRFFSETTTDIRGNFTDRWLDRWTVDNPDGSLPRIGNSFNEGMTSFWLENTSYLRLKNLEIGYTFKNIKYVGISSLRLYFNATNLLTFTPLKDFDPEKGSGDTRMDNYPNSKTISFGVNVTF